MTYVSIFLPQILLVKSSGRQPRANEPFVTQWLGWSGSLRISNIKFQKFIYLIFPHIIQDKPSKKKQINTIVLSHFTRREYIACENIHFFIPLDSKNWW